MQQENEERALVIDIIAQTKKIKQNQDTGHVDLQNFLEEI
jgi:hypothetical protein